MRNGSPSKRSKPKRTTDDPEKIEPSSGNVFADLGLPDPEVALAKARLVQQIRALIKAKSLTQARAGQLLGIDQPKVSALVRGRVAGYSLERLFRFLNALGQDVAITVRPGASGVGSTVVVDAVEAT